MTVVKVQLPDNMAARESAENIAEIYEKHRKGLKGFISNRVKYVEDAEDIMQNVFQSLVKLDLMEQPIEKISSWLYAVARNQITDHYRKKREERLPCSADRDGFLDKLPELFAGTNDDPETSYLKAMVWEELELSLGELPDEQRSVFELNELQGFSFKEISESTGIAVNTLISRKRYAVIHLRQRLRELYDSLID